MELDINHVTKSLYKSKCLFWIMRVVVNNLQYETNFTKDSRELKTYSCYFWIFNSDLSINRSINQMSLIDARSVYLSNCDPQKICTDLYLYTYIYREAFGDDDASVTHFVNLFGDDNSIFTHFLIYSVTMTRFSCVLLAYSVTMTRFSRFFVNLFSDGDANFKILVHTKMCSTLLKKFWLQEIKKNFHNLWLVVNKIFYTAIWIEWLMNNFHTITSLDHIYKYIYNHAHIYDRVVHVPTSGLSYRHTM